MTDTKTRWPKALSVNLLKLLGDAQNRVGDDSKKKKETRKGRRVGPAVVRRFLGSTAGAELLRKE